jgi:GMP synthase (glutamine-hydrolysing)
MEDPARKGYALQFHPEVEHTEHGTEIIRNFLYRVCECAGDWTTGNLIEESIEAIRQQVGDRNVLCALSGGVDSSVAAVLVHQAMGDQLTCVFVDHGLLRKGEGDQVENLFTNQFKMNFIRVNAQERFLSGLKGVKDPEKKRKFIGETFIRVFEEEAGKLGEMDFLVQGTLYPDIIESGTETAAVIKSHHNVGGLPEDMQFQLIEPFKYLFKDEVRAVGGSLGSAGRSGVAAAIFRVPVWQSVCWVKLRKKNFTLFGKLMQWSEKKFKKQAWTAHLAIFCSAAGNKKRGCHG